MTDKNRRKLQAKKARNFWTCARPVTQIVPNKRAYNRKREKDIRCIQDSAGMRSRHWML